MPVFAHQIVDNGGQWPLLPLLCCITITTRRNKMDIVKEELDVDDDMMALFAELLSSSSDEEDETKHRQPNKARDFAGAYARVVKNYFSGPESVYDDVDFERRFRMSRRLFNQIHDRIMGLDPFVQKYDKFKKTPGIYPLVKLVGCFRFLAYGSAYDSFDEHLSIGEQTLKDYVRDFCQLIIQEYGDQYLNRSPTAEERAAISNVMTMKGFPGCIGSWDCKHFVWKNCPVRLQGQHQGHAEGGRKTLILEAIADHRRYFWQVNFGDPGALNDINVLDKSSIIGGLMSGNFSIKTDPYVINGRQRDWNYFLVDGIYPEWSIFVTTFTKAIDQRKRRFAATQERVRKDIECAFGVLLQRFHILARPLRGWYLDDIVALLNCCIILHNMIVDDRFGTLDMEGPIVAPHNGFALFGRRAITAQQAQADGIDLFAARVAAFDVAMQSCFEHCRLKNDLVEHINK